MNIIFSAIWLLVGGRTYQISRHNPVARTLSLLSLSLSVFVYCNPVSFSTPASAALTLTGLAVQAAFLLLVFYALGQKNHTVTRLTGAQKRRTGSAPAVPLVA